MLWPYHRPCQWLCFSYSSCDYIVFWSKGCILNPLWRSCGFGRMGQFAKERSDRIRRLPGIPWRLQYASGLYPWRSRGDIWNTDRPAVLNWSGRPGSWGLCSSFLPCYQYGPCHGRFQWTWPCKIVLFVSYRPGRQTSGVPRVLFSTCIHRAMMLTAWGSCGLRFLFPRCGQRRWAHRMHVLFFLYTSWH